MSLNSKEAYTKFQEKSGEMTDKASKYMTIDCYNDSNNEPLNKKGQQIYYTTRKIYCGRGQTILEVEE